MLWVCFFAFSSCYQQTSSPDQRNTAKKIQAIPSARNDRFAPPIIIPIRTSNRPKPVKAGKPIIRIDSSQVGIPFFTNYGTEQGLEQGSVFCSAVDKAGNLWFGTIGGGVSQYDGKRFINYTINQGLANNVVLSILEDKAGNLWFGTTGGVSKYNGYSFVNFTIDQGLADNYVLAILEDKRGNIWFGTGKGVSKFDGSKFTNYTTAHGLVDNYVTCIAQDQAGSLWFGTHAGISKYTGRRFTKYTTADGLAGNYVNSVLQDRAGNLWFGTDGGVSKYDGSSFTNFTTADGLVNNNVACITQDKADNLWIGTKAGGMSKYDGSRFTNYTKARGLADNNISSFVQDRADNLWFTSLGGGVSKYEGSSLVHFTEMQGLEVNMLNSILQDKAGTIWLATFNGGVINYDGQRFANFTTAQGLADNIVWNTLQDKAGNLWFTTNQGGVSKYDGKNFTTYTTAQGLADNTVFSVIEDKNGNIWFGTNSGASKFNGNGFTNYAKAQGLPGLNIVTMMQDKAGDIWFGTHDDGISRYNGHSFTNYNTANGLADNSIVYSIVQDENEDIWFGTSKGAIKYDGKHFINYTTEQGLASSFIWGITKDTTRNMIWFGTNGGLSGLALKPATNPGSRQDMGFLNFDRSTGYKIEAVNTSAMLADNKGIIWAGGGHNKLIRFDYSAINRKNTTAFNLALQGVKVNDELICWNNLLRRRQGNKAVDSLALLNEMVLSFGNVLSPLVLDSLGKKYRDIQLDGVARFNPVPINLVLPYNDNNITIDFVAIDPAMQKQVKYQYKLEGYSNEWSPLSNKSTAVFGNMVSGSYTFKLKAVNPFGVWSETEYTFRVLPPWWFTWWAYIVYVLVGGGLLYTLYRNRIRIIEREQAIQLNIMVATQEEERKRIAKDLHDDVGIKLSALKLYVSSLYEKASSTDNDNLMLLAQNSENLISEVMQDVRQLLVNLSPMVLEEFGYTAAVEGLTNKINETKQLQFNLVVFGMEHRLPKDYELALYRITQELINNVLKHAEAKAVSLQIGQRDEKLILMIEDDGKGFDVASHKDGYGLHNLEARTKLMNGKMTIDSRPHKGTSVLIEIPYTLQ